MKIEVKKRPVCKIVDLDLNDLFLLKEAMIAYCISGANPTGLRREAEKWIEMIGLAAEEARDE